MLSLYKDREENLWIGTDGGGLNRLKRREFQTYTANDGLSHDRATSIYQSRDGSVWIGTAGGLNPSRATPLQRIPPKMVYRATSCERCSKMTGEICGSAQTERD